MSSIVPAPSKVVLLTGPAGAGKTTSGYLAIAKHLKNEEAAQKNNGDKNCIKKRKVIVHYDCDLFQWGFSPDQITECGSSGVEMPQEKCWHAVENYLTEDRKKLTHEMFKLHGDLWTTIDRRTVLKNGGKLQHECEKLKEKIRNPETKKSVISQQGSDAITAYYLAVQEDAEEAYEVFVKNRIANDPDATKEDEYILLIAHVVHFNTDRAKYARFFLDNDRASRKFDYSNTKFQLVCLNIDADLLQSRVVKRCGLYAEELGYNTKSVVAEAEVEANDLIQRTILKGATQENRSEMLDLAGKLRTDFVDLAHRSVVMEYIQNSIPNELQRKMCREMHDGCSKAGYEDFSDLLIGNCNDEDLAYMKKALMTGRAAVQSVEVTEDTSKDHMVDQVLEIILEGEEEVSCDRNAVGATTRENQCNVGENLVTEYLNVNDADSTLSNLSTPCVYNALITGCSKRSGVGYHTVHDLLKYNLKTRKMIAQATDGTWSQSDYQMNVDQIRKARPQMKVIATVRDLYASELWQDIPEDVKEHWRAQADDMQQQHGKDNCTDFYGLCKSFLKSPNSKFVASDDLSPSTADCTPVNSPDASRQLDGAKSAEVTTSKTMLDTSALDSKLLRKRLFDEQSRLDGAKAKSAVPKALAKGAFDAKDDVKDEARKKRSQELLELLQTTEERIAYFEDLDIRLLDLSSEAYCCEDVKKEKKSWSKRLMRTVRNYEKRIYENYDRSLPLHLLAKNDDVQESVFHVEKDSLSDNEKLERNIQSFTKKLLDDHDGRVDILVNNAANVVLGAIESISARQLQKNYETKLFGPFFLVQSLLPAMRRNGRGLITTPSSRFAPESLAKYTALSTYFGAIQALETMHMQLSIECEKFGIRSILFRPGGIATELCCSTGDRTMGDMLKCSSNLTGRNNADAGPNVVQKNDELIADTFYKGHLEKCYEKCVFARLPWTPTEETCAALADIIVEYCESNFSKNGKGDDLGDAMFRYVGDEMKGVADIVVKNGELDLTGAASRRVYLDKILK